MMRAATSSAKSISWFAPTRSRNRILVELNARLCGVHLRVGHVQKANASFDVALEIFERRIRLGGDDPFTRYYAVSVHAMRGDAEPALAFLEHALAELRAFTAARAFEPEFDSVYHDPRFERLFGVAAHRPWPRLQLCTATREGASERAIRLAMAQSSA
jgi:tetratricopeptide (TPR) repeat protein